MLSRAALRPLKASTSRLPSSCLATSVAGSTLRRSLATEADSVPKKSPRPTGHVSVEELHSRTAADILKERDSGSHAGEMRHFTVNFGKLAGAGHRAIGSQNTGESTTANEQTRRAVKAEHTFKLVTDCNQMLTLLLRNSGVPQVLNIRPLTECCD